jgi:hypothetical protein
LSGSPGTHEAADLLWHVVEKAPGVGLADLLAVCLADVDVVRVRDAMKGRKE